MIAKIATTIPNQFNLDNFSLKTKNAIKVLNKTIPIFTIGKIAELFC